MNPTYAQAMALLNTVQPNLRQAITDQLNGHPRAQAYDTDRTSGGGGSDPTATAAIVPDRARHDLEQYTAAVVRIYTAALTLAALSDHYEPARDPGRNIPPNPPKACKLHMLATGKVHAVWRTSDMGNHLDKPLTEPTPLCEPCFDAIRYYGAVPDKASIIHYERTGRWGMKAKRVNPKAA